MVCYSDLQMAAALRLAGVSAGPAAILVATSHPESNGCGVMQQGQPYGTTGWGPWQITPGNSEPQCGTNAQLFGLGPAACAAAAKLRSQGLGAWTTVTSGAYKASLPAALSAVASVFSMSQQQVKNLAATAGHGGGGANAQTTSFPLPGVGNLGGTIISGLASAIGAASVKDLFIRLGLVVLGGLLLLVGVMMLTGKEIVQTAEAVK